MKKSSGQSVDGPQKEFFADGKLSGEIRYSETSTFGRRSTNSGCVLA